MSISKIIPINTIKKYTATGINPITNGDLIWKVDESNVAKIGAFLEKSLYYASTDTNADVFQLDTNKWVITGAISNYGIDCITTISNNVLTHDVGTGFDNPPVGTVRKVSGCKINSSKYAIAYTRQVGGVEKVSCVITTVSGTTKTHGTIVDIDTLGNSSSSVSVCLVDTDKIAVAYIDYDGANYDHKCAIATISGTVPTFGSSVEYKSNLAGSVGEHRICSPTTNKIAIAYNWGSGGTGYCIVATISTTTPTFGSEVQFETGVTSNISICKIDTDKIAIAYKDEGNSNYGTAVVATISTTTPTFGTPVVFESSASTYTSIIAPSISSIIIVYVAGNTIKGIGARISETTKPTFNTAYLIRNANNTQVNLGIDEITKQILITYIESGGYAQLSELNSKGIAISSEDYATRSVAITLF